MKEATAVLSATVQAARLLNQLSLVLVRTQKTLLFCTMYTIIVQVNMFLLGYCFLLAAPPRIVTHPQEIKATYGTSVTLTVEVVGTEPLSYMWQLKTGGWIGWWQSCDVESFPGATTPTLLIPSVQKSNEGSYRCVISNCVGSQTSKAAKLEVSWYISERIVFAELASSLFT